MTSTHLSLQYHTASNLTKNISGDLLRSIALPGLETYWMTLPGGGAPLAPGYSLWSLRSHDRVMPLDPCQVGLMEPHPLKSLRNLRIQEPEVEDAHICNDRNHAGLWLLAAENVNEISVSKEKHSIAQSNAW
jgi:hypothetical protein